MRGSFACTGGCSPGPERSGIDRRSLWPKPLVIDYTDQPRPGAFRRFSVRGRWPTTRSLVRFIHASLRGAPWPCVPGRTSRVRTSIIAASAVAAGSAGARSVARSASRGSASSTKARTRPSWRVACLYLRIHREKVSGTVDVTPSAAKERDVGSRHLFRHPFPTPLIPGPTSSEILRAH